mgnify:FL=1
MSIKKGYSVIFVSFIQIKGIHHIVAVVGTHHGIGEAY